MNLSEIFPRCQQFTPSMQSRIEKAGLSADDWVENAMKSVYPNVRIPAEVIERGKDSVIIYLQAFGDAQLMVFISESIPA